MGGREGQALDASTRDTAFSLLASMASSIDDQASDITQGGWDWAWSTKGTPRTSGA